MMDDFLTGDTGVVNWGPIAMMMLRDFPKIIVHEVWGGIFFHDPGDVNSGLDLGKKDTRGE